MQATSLPAGSRVRARSVRVARLCRAIAGTAIAVGLLAVPASASAADLTATPSTFASVWSLRSGRRPDPAGVRQLRLLQRLRVEVLDGHDRCRSPVRRRRCRLSFNGASNIRVEGLTVTGLSIQGTTRNITVADSLFTGQAVIRSGGAANANIVLDGNRHPNINVGGCGTCYEGRIQVLSTGGSNPSGVTIKNSVLRPGRRRRRHPERRRRRPDPRQRVHRHPSDQRCPFGFAAAVWVAQHGDPRQLLPRLRRGDHGARTAAATSRSPTT